MERALVVDRKGQNMSFIGAGNYHVQTRWNGGVTLYASGVPCAFFWRPISIVIGLASPDEIEKFRAGMDAHDASLMGVKL